VSGIRSRNLPGWGRIGEVSLALSGLNTGSGAELVALLFEVQNIWRTQNLNSDSEKAFNTGNFKVVPGHETSHCSRF
jgi:hypothetical protein